MCLLNTRIKKKEKKSARIVLQIKYTLKNAVGEISIATHYM